MVVAPCRGRDGASKVRPMSGNKPVVLSQTTTTDNRHGRIDDVKDGCRDA
jgi:hypothetical protein